MAVEHSASKTILICCLASFSSRSLAVGNTGTMTVFRNTLDRATTGARGGATLVRANAASTAPARIYNFAKSVIYFLVAAKPSNSSTGLAFNDKKYNIPVLLPSCSAHFANFPPAQAGLGRLSIWENQYPGNSKSGKLKIQKTQKAGKLIIQEIQNMGNPKSGKLEIRETQNLRNSKSGKLKIRETKL